MAFAYGSRAMEISEIQEPAGAGAVKLRAFANRPGLAQRGGSRGGGSTGDHQFDERHERHLAGERCECEGAASTGQSQYRARLVADVGCRSEAAARAPSPVDRSIVYPCRSASRQCVCRWTTPTSGRAEVADTAPEKRHWRVTCSSCDVRATACGRSRCDERNCRAGH